MPSRFKAAFTYFNQAVPFKLPQALVTTAVLIALLLLPCPEGLTPKAWGLVAIFLTTIIAIILKVMPIGVMAMMALVIVALSQVTSTNSKGAITDALSSFSSPLIWLIVVAILISRGLKKTGLGNRIGMLFIALLGKRTLGIGYGLTICELLLAPFTPSNTARGGGIVHPIMRSIANSFDSDPAKGTQGKVGTYLALVNYHANPITSAMFLTATAPNPLVVDYVAKATNQQLHLSWTTWALCMFLPGLACLIIMPLAIYLLSPPELKVTPNAVDFAKGQLRQMGALTAKEKVMIGTFGLLLVLWANVPAMIFGAWWTLDPTVVAFVGLFALIITGTLDWDDVLSEKSAWDTLVWFGALVMMAEQLNKLGVVGWFTEAMKGAIIASGMGWKAIAGVLVLAFVFSHYLFASTTAHISAMLLAFLGVGALLIPPDYVIPFMLMMTASSAIMMTLTHYATGTSPIVFGSGYVSLGTWWKIGLVMCLLELLIFGLVGSMWWKILGFW
ncbi:MULTISPECIES: DASS family sodium-coupled anion symporter [Xanthomonas]|uniref:C4-dicarboxylate ABC transporter n=1 Tax=Xanthomonas arboricola TaxID=56448 RepID=A0A2S7AHE9_9XANT|nr:MULTISPECIES: DASS family sodium-coupled anion symporter [Xanthomonas]MEB1609049.1 DASS family sodium-coupled anion symporter [Xanthomonas campestris pv. campestris]MBB3848761.1 DASS family divalent anion:Na+ symporter [Xanthomonas arboricola]MBB5734872.1 DASS family divalent anion:Na+ symporter [Xanthomonas sp. CFBP 8152]PPT23824.1 C4-dicarboxylate ABC transporter [Xanthomonas arboricola]PPT80835.1 C4-dicarboxylate ABC transporter [Xanthomonas arboricola]